MTYFISGIDTGIGKTVATGRLCRYLERLGRKWISVKLVQTGCDGFSEDLEEHRKIAGVGPFPEDEEGLTAPQIFKFPSSPLLAAQLEGKKVDLNKISAAVKTLEERYETVIVEGVGGLCVPLTEETLTIDFAAKEGWPLLLVASGRLGSINHILLSLEAAQARGMKVLGVIYNDFPAADPKIFADTEKTIKRYLEKLGTRHSPEARLSVRSNREPLTAFGGYVPKLFNLAADDFEGL